MKDICWAFWLGAWVGNAFGAYQSSGSELAFVCLFFGVTPVAIYLLATLK